jgi:AAA domain
MITVVTGPPCAGKTAHVRKHALPGDVVIDFDEIAKAIGSPENHDHQDWVREITAAAWAAAVKRALHYNRHRVWIIDSRPLPVRRQDYDAAGVRYVHLSADPAELHRRVETDGRSPAWHGHIDRFLAASGKDPRPASRIRW